MAALKLLFSVISKHGLVTGRVKKRSAGKQKNTNRNFDEPQILNQKSLEPLLNLTVCKTTKCGGSFETSLRLHGTPACILKEN